MVLRRQALGSRMPLKRARPAVTKRGVREVYEREALALLEAEFHRFSTADIRRTFARSGGCYERAWVLLDGEDTGTKAELSLRPLDDPRPRSVEAGRPLEGPRRSPRSLRLRREVSGVQRRWARDRSEFKMWADGLFYSLDRDGQEQLLDADGAQVMMAWERPYMVRCVEALKIDSTSDVLEVGFGCGYSANRIQAEGPRSHTIIECSETVLERLREWARTRPNVIVVEGTWQETLPTLGVFDCIFFDDYGTPGRADREMEEYCPRASYKQEYAEALSHDGGTHFHGFLNIALRWHARESTRITGYLEYPIAMQRDDVLASFDHTPVDPPAHCDYWPTELTKEAVVPLFVKQAAAEEQGAHPPLGEQGAPRSPCGSEGSTSAPDDVSIGGFSSSSHAEGVWPCAC